MTFVVLIDIDVDYDYMTKYGLFDVLSQKIEWCTKAFNIDVEYLNIDKSQCNHVHLHMISRNNLDPETVFQLKYCVGEDHKRLNYSIRRYEKTGKILDFFWMHKVKDCKEKEEEK